MTPLVKVSVMVLRESGPQTRVRLDRLVRHYAYGLTREQLAVAQEEAWQEHLSREAQDRGS